MVHSKSNAIRKELRSLILLALPITTGQVAQTANGFVDTLMAGAVSPLDLAAVAIGTSIWVPVFLFMTGILIATTPTVAQLYGAKNYSSIPTAVRQSLWLALIIGVIGMLAVRFAYLLLPIMKVDPSLHELARGYLEGASWGMPPIALYIVLRSFSEGMSHTKPMMFTSIMGLMINIPTNYILIFGKLGFPAMGGVGCGWSTAFVMWLMLFAMAIYVHKGKPYRETPLFNIVEPPRLKPQLNILKVGLPIGFTIFFEVSIFSIIALLIGSLGADVVAGHQIAFNFASLTFMLPLSLALALTIRVGQGIGADDMDNTRFTCQIGIALTACIAICLSCLMALGNHWIAAIYTKDEHVRQLAATLLLFAAVFQISDGLQAAGNGALRGFKDTKVPMLFTLIAYWGVGLPCGYILGMTDLLIPAMGAKGFWIGLVMGLTTAAVLLNGRLFYIFKNFHLFHLSTN